MGSSCSSLERNTTNKNTDMKLKFAFGSKNQNLVIPPSPIKEQQPKNRNFMWSPSRSTTNFTDYGSKDEEFFDSKPWIDSDCEDDFYSVTGDFTPSRGNTPVHHNFGTPGVNKTPFQNRTPGSLPEPSPDKKKNLFDLFKESVKDDQDNGNGRKEVKPTIQDVLPQSEHSNPYLSGPNSTCSSETTMSGGRASFRETSAKSLQGCFPSLSSCRSFSERRRKTSPAIGVNGNH